MLCLAHLWPNSRRVVLRQYDTEEEIKRRGIGVLPGKSALQLHAELSLEEIARAVNLSPSRFCHLFKAAMGLPRYLASDSPGRTKGSSVPPLCCGGPL